jgi:hypothetical protein
MPRAKKSIETPTENSVETKIPPKKPQPHVGVSLEPAPPAGQVLAHQGLTVLEVADAADLQSLLVDPRVKPLILAVLSTTQALVLPQNSKTLLEVLRKAGHTPKVQSEGVATTKTTTGSKA